MSLEANNKSGLITRVWQWLKGFAMRHKIISFLVLFYLVSRAVATPIVNPFASDVYTIRGRFPFDKGFALSFRQYAYGTAPWFKRWCGWPFYEEGTCTGDSHWVEPTRIGENHYEVRIYRDRYFSALGGWKEATVFLPYLATAFSDREKMLITSYAGQESSVCIDDEVNLKKFRGNLMCFSQLAHKDFRVLHLADGQPVRSDERLINFWLESELSPMLEKQKQGAKP